MANPTDALTNETVIIELSAGAYHQRDLVEDLTTITSGLKTFLLILIDIASEKAEANQKSGSHLVGRSQIQDKLIQAGHGASDALVSRRLAELKKAGVCEMETQIQESKRVNHYKLANLTKLALLKPRKANSTEGTKQRRRTKSIINAQRELFSDDRKGLLLSGPEDIIFFNQQLFNGILDTAMRVSSKDERKTISVTYKVHGDPLRITSSCSAKEGSGLLMMTDQRAMRCIISYCKKRIEHLKLKLTDQYGAGFDRRFIPNVFHIDIHELCSLMGMRCVNTNLDIVVGMMERLSDTTFEVDASDNPWFMNTFSMFLLAKQTEDDQPIRSDRYKIQFLNNFESARENESLPDLFGDSMENLRPRYYTFSLEQRLFYSLISDEAFNLFLSHEELSTERSGIVQRFYNWARAYISGRNKPGVEKKWFTLHEIHAALTPGHRLDNFRNYFLSALEKFSVSEDWNRKGSGTSLIYGYYVNYKRENGEDYFQIQRDREDPIVGDNSRHNVLLRQKQIDLLG